MVPNTTTTPATFAACFHCNKNVSKMSTHVTVKASYSFSSFLYWGNSDTCRLKKLLNKGMNQVFFKIDVYFQKLSRLLSNIQTYSREQLKNGKAHCHQKTKVFQSTSLQCINEPQLWPTAVILRPLSVRTPFVKFKNKLILQIPSKLEKVQNNQKLFWIQYHLYKWLITQPLTNIAPM